MDSHERGNPNPQVWGEAYAYVICYSTVRLSKPDKQSHWESNGRRKLEIRSSNEHGDSKKDLSHRFTNFLYFTAI